PARPLAVDARHAAPTQLHSYPTRRSSDLGHATAQTPRSPLQTGLPAAPTVRRAGGRRCRTAAGWGRRGHPPPTAPPRRRLGPPAPRARPASAWIPPARRLALPRGGP